MKKFTMAEREQGAFAVRSMSKKAADFYSSVDYISVYKYVDYDATDKAEEEAINNGIDFYAGELNVIKYAINDSGTFTLDLTFEEVEKYLEELNDAE